MPDLVWNVIWFAAGVVVGSVACGVLWVIRTMDSDLEGYSMASEGESELEREAIALVRQYGVFLPSPAKAFLRKLAAHLGWTEFKV